MTRGFFTAPNVVTLLRLLLVPVFVVFHLRGNIERAAWCFGIAMVSDLLDGLLARVLNQRSAWGAFLDPLADKLLVGAALLLLFRDGLAPLWLLVIIALRDGMMAGGAALLRRKRMELPQLPSRIGKYATFCSTAFVLLGLGGQTHFAPPQWMAYFWVFGYLAGLCVIISTAQYIARFGYLLFVPPRHA